MWFLIKFILFILVTYMANEIRLKQKIKESIILSVYFTVSAVIFLL